MKHPYFITAVFIYPKVKKGKPGFLVVKCPVSTDGLIEFSKREPECYQFFERQFVSTLVAAELTAERMIKSKK